MKKQQLNTKRPRKKQDHKMQTRKTLSLVDKKKADNTNTKQCNFIVETANRQHKKQKTITQA